MRTFTPDQVDSMFAWTIDSLPCFGQDQATGAFVPVAHKRALVRHDTGRGLGIVSDRYGIVQPASAPARQTQIVTNTIAFD